MKANESRTTIIISAFIFIISLAALITASQLWENLESISAAVAAAAVFGAAYFAYQELEEVSKARHIDVADRLFDELNAPKSIQARRRVFKLEGNPEEILNNLSEEDRDAMKTVLNSLDRVAFLTQPGWVSDELVMPWMHPMIFKSWEKLEPIVQFEREKRGESYYYEHAENLAKRCMKWRRENLPPQEQKTRWVDTTM
ncbi:MAG: DUF4760 domain-containing protein [Anaerolineales bacterium]|jgi:hypothetical protein